MLDCIFKIQAERQRIQTIEDQTLAHCCEVVVLDLGFNEISEISKNSFQN